MRLWHPFIFLFFKPLRGSELRHLRLENFLYDFKDSDFLYLGTALAQPGKGLYPMAAHGSSWQPRCASSQDGEFRGWQMSRRTTDGSNSPIAYSMGHQHSFQMGFWQVLMLVKLYVSCLYLGVFLGSFPFISPIGALTSKETHWLWLQQVLLHEDSGRLFKWADFVFFNEQHNPKYPTTQKVQIRVFPFSERVFVCLPRKWWWKMVAVGIHESVNKMGSSRWIPLEADWMEWNFDVEIWWAFKDGANSSYPRVWRKNSCHTRTAWRYSFQNRTTFLGIRR